MGAAAPTETTVDEGGPSTAARHTALSELAAQVQRIDEVADALEALDPSATPEAATEANPSEVTHPGEGAEAVTDADEVETTDESEG